MALLTWQDLTDPAYGAGTAIGSMISAAGGFYCDMIRKYPNWSLQNPLGLDPISRGINDKLCGGSPPLPLPDNPAVPGGKCQCVQYDVAYTGRLAQGSSFSGVFRVRGGISQAQYFTNSSGNIAFGFKAYNEQCNRVESFNVIDNVTLADIESGQAFGRIDTITRVDGQPDLCGDQPPTYKPIVPPVNEVNRVVPILIAPGIAIAAPIIFIRPTANININPTLNFNLTPVFNFPSLGINISPKINGIEINNTINFVGGNQPGLPDPRPDPPTIPPSAGSDTDLTEVYRRLTELKNLSDEIKECACDENPPLTAIGLGTGNSFTASLPANTKFVVMTIIEIPGNRKFQDGLFAPDVLYAGWAWFGYEPNFLALRDPVDSERKVFFAQPGAKQFAWTLYQGFRATCVAYSETTV